MSPTTETTTDADHPVRTIDGTQLPAPGRWVIDAGHTELAFVGRHFMLTRVRGRFTGIAGAITVAAEPTDSTVEVEIDMASVESGSAERDEHLRSSDLFDVERWPRASLRSTAVRWDGTSGEIEADLTIRGVTAPVTLGVEYLGHVTDPWGGERAVLSARGTIDRTDWGIDWNMPLATGGVVVSKRIDLEVELEAVLET